MIMVEFRNHSNSNSRVKEYVRKVKDMLCNIEDCMEEEDSSRSYDTEDYDDSYGRQTPCRRNRYRY